MPRICPKPDFAARENQVERVQLGVNTNAENLQECQRPRDGITQQGFTRLSSREAGRVRPARRERAACRRASALARSSRLWEAGQSGACFNARKASENR